MSRTIKDLDLGTPIYIEEKGVPKEYVLITKSADGCIVLRANCYEARGINATNTAVYEYSEMDLWLENEETGFMSLFTAQQKMAFVARSRPTYTYGDTECHYINRRAFLLTYGELFLSTPTALEPLSNIVPLLMLWKHTADANTARIATDEANRAVSWWESSPFSASAMYHVYTNGSSNYYAAAPSGYWARPALNVSSDTIVSDEGASTIYLMPSQGYREVSFSAKASELEARPAKAIVDYTATNLYDVAVEVCNNYGDNNPDWVAATSGQEVSLPNDVKQTENWQVGIRCYGKSASYGFFEEPIIKLEVE
jgi:hypothetical protein